MQCCAVICYQTAGSGIAARIVARSHQITVLPQEAAGVYVGTRPANFSDRVSQSARSGIVSVRSVCFCSPEKVTARRREIKRIECRSLVTEQGCLPSTN
jgi:hypothetical protein